MTPRCEFEVSRHFDAALAERYERRIRMFCPSYDALHEIIGTVLSRLSEGSSILSAGAGTGGRPLPGQVLCNIPQS
jgi:tRNA (cmo5U34)-methyltransferase